MKIQKSLQVMYPFQRVWHPSYFDAGSITNQINNLAGKFVPKKPPETIPTMQIKIQLNLINDVYNGAKTVSGEEQSVMRLLRIDQT